MLILLFLFIAAAIAVVVLYNNLVRLKLQCTAAWADIGVQLKRRHDLVPNLVETVKGYAAHEESVLKEVVEARAAAVSAAGPAEAAMTEGGLTRALKSLFALAESYPQLRASENFAQLHSSLDEIEEAIQSARRYHNAVVRDFNTRVQQFPTNLVATTFNFRSLEFFSVEEGEAAVPRVDFSGR